MSRSFAKTLRANMTVAERWLWYRLRAHRLEGIKFKRQVTIGKYIADFACMERKLLVEVDGGQHAEELPTSSERNGSNIKGFASCGSGIMKS